MPSKPVVQLINPVLFTQEYKRTRNIEAVDLMKEKRDGRIKGRTCADGSRKHRNLNMVKW